MILVDTALWTTLTAMGAAERIWVGMAPWHGSSLVWALLRGGVMLQGRDLILFLALRVAALQRRVNLYGLMRACANLHVLEHEMDWQIDAGTWRTAARQASALRTLGICVVPCHALPQRLTEHAPVPALFVRGNAQLLQWPAVAVVGSRRAGAHAIAWAAQFAAQRAAAGNLVISGGARGVDAAAHGGAIEVGAPTLAYIGAAIDHIYPAANKKLFAAMLEAGGAIVSEHPPLGMTYAYHHAWRNRFIAAHATQLVVAEAAGRSGTLGTVRWARRFAREVWVAPAPVGGQRDGINMLLAKGWARELGADAA